MANVKISDRNVTSYTAIYSPKELSEKYPATDTVRGTVLKGRDGIEKILEGKDNRKMIILGPCSIHNTDQAIEYAERVRGLSNEVGDRFQLIMRTYFEKPRTTNGWKGLISDPRLDGSYKMQEGLVEARKLLLKIADMGIPVGTEFLDPQVPSYIAELVSWAAIGARTTESQTHREMASGLSMPVGFKNGTSGGVGIATNAITSSASGHSFLGVSQNGSVAQVNTLGNKYGHLILRGGKNGTNYDTENIADAQEIMRGSGLSPNVVIDCSHGNSAKDYRAQSKVFNDVMRQIVDGNKKIVGVMLESNLEEGSQKIVPGENLQEGVSVTDGCIGWDKTRQIILDAYDKLSS